MREAKNPGIIFLDSPVLNRKSEAQSHETSGFPGLLLLSVTLGFWCYTKHVTMTADAIREAMHATPFVPFVLEVVGGKRYLVDHPDFLAVSRNGRTLTLYTEGGHSVTLDIGLIAQIDHNASAA